VQILAFLAVLGLGHEAINNHVEGMLWVVTCSYLFRCFGRSGRIYFPWKEEPVVEIRNTMLPKVRQ
jgi:hypothetical protein